MGEYYTDPADHIAKMDAIRQQQIDDFRKNTALQALQNTYGDQAADPDVWLKGSQASAAAQEAPLAGQTAQATLEGKQAETATAQQGLQQKRLVTIGALLKGQNDPSILDNPAVQKFGGFSADDAAQMKPFITGADGKVDPAKVDAITNAGLGSAGMLFKGAPIISVDANGQPQATFTNPRGGMATQALPGAPVSLMNAESGAANRASLAQNRPVLPNGQVNPAYVSAKQQVAKTAASNNITLTPEGLNLATQYFMQTGQMPNMGMGGTANKTAVVNNAAAKGATGEQLAGSAQDYKSKQVALSDLSRSSPTSAGGLVRSAGAVIQHIDTLDQFIGALQNKNIRAVNALSQRFKEETGNPAPTNFDLQKKIVASELTKFLQGGRATLTDRKELEQAVSRANSPQALHKVIETMKADLGAQLGSQYAQFEGIGASKEYLRTLTPAARFMITGVAEPGQNVAISHPPAGSNGVVDYRSYFGSH